VFRCSWMVTHVFKPSRLTFLSSIEVPPAFLYLSSLHAIKFLLRSSKPQCQFSATKQVCVHLDNEDLLLIPLCLISPRPYSLLNCLCVPVHNSTCDLMLIRSIAHASTTHSLPLSTQICLATHCKTLHLTILSCFNKCRK